MKKAMLLAICLILAGLLAVNGTFASELGESITEAVNTVFITLSELFSDDLAKPHVGGGFHVSLAYLDSNGNVVTDAALPQLLPGSTVERRTAVKNESNASESNASSAYFCIAFAVQAEAQPKLTLTFNEEESSGYEWSEEWRDITINGHPYKLMIGTYQNELPAGHTAPPALLSVKLDADVTSEQIAQIRSDFLQIQVLAIRADDFKDSEGAPMSAKDALNKALSMNSSDFNPFK